MRVLLDFFWVICFFIVWVMLGVFWNSIGVLILMPCFVVMLGGLSEFMHQCVHGNLFGGRKLTNNLLGKTTAALLGVDFFAYRKFHLSHHGTANTEDDPEHRGYGSGYATCAVGWETFAWWQKLWLVPKLAWNFGSTLLKEFGGSGGLISLFSWGIPFVIGITGYLTYANLFTLSWWALLGIILVISKILIVWYLPLGCLLIFDLLLSQSRHYGAELTTKNDLQSQHDQSWNLRFPRIVSVMLMRRNMHAEHHLTPNRHWSQVPPGDPERTMSVTKYLRLWWTHGPRTV